MRILTNLKLSEEFSAIGGIMVISQRFLGCLHSILSNLYGLAYCYTQRLFSHRL